MTRFIGRGWATVEAERAQAELQTAGVVDGPFRDVGRSSWLGARCRRAKGAGGDTVDAAWVVVLEADTEGRLAAYLARHGEGWAVTWESGTVGPQPTATRQGPFGPEMLPPDQPTSGPFRLVVAPATIES